ncbi:hypothetical protein EVAR_4252_1 [Eumeta japonica]|uniref:Uncharacterized protein n=1 Tax=Eumeta variegata TaxID=151549 RepID=A0A4C1Z7A5_EUMVA|nr:hypothetical protein EVAR_4252_1 [Eumeta japonica]
MTNTRLYSDASVVSGPLSKEELLLEIKDFLDGYRISVWEHAPHHHGLVNGGQQVPKYAASHPHLRATPKIVTLSAKGSSDNGSQLTPISVY